MKPRSSLKISVSGVRGVVGESLTPQIAATFAQAFGSYVGAGAIVVGRDTRPTGVMMQQAVTAGLISVGCEVIEVGVCPTPTILFLVKQLGAAGGVAITASHNPVEWNAMKFIGPGGLFLNSNQATEMLDVYHQSDFRIVAESRLRAPRTLPDPVQPHLDRILSLLDLAPIRHRKPRVVVDACNGAAAPFDAAFLQSLGCDAVLIHAEPTGVFARGAEPVTQNLGALCEAVKRERADVGFAQDPDGDRLAIVDEQGRPIGEDYSLALAAKYVLARRKGPVVMNLSTSRVVADVASAAGCEVRLTKVGEINVTQELLDCGGAIGGEGSGGVIWPDVHPCRDSFTTMALVLALLADTRQSVSELVAGLPRYEIVKDKIPGTGERAQRMLRHVRERFADKKVSLVDGVRIDFERSWVNLRPSNTEPIIRIVAEAPTRDEAARLVEELKATCQALNHPSPTTYD